MTLSLNVLQAWWSQAQTPEADQCTTVIARELALVIGEATPMIFLL